MLLRLLKFLFYFLLFIAWIFISSASAVSDTKPAQIIGLINFSLPFLIMGYLVYKLVKSFIKK